MFPKIIFTNETKMENKLSVLGPPGFSATFIDKTSQLSEPESNNFPLVSQNQSNQEPSKTTAFTAPVSPNIQDSHLSSSYGNDKTGM